jgi:hypothetical protein
MARPQLSDPYIGGILLNFFRNFLKKFPNNFFSKEKRLSACLSHQLYDRRMAATTGCCTGNKGCREEGLRVEGGLGPIDGG